MGNDSGGTRQPGRTAPRYRQYFDLNRAYIKLIICNHALLGGAVIPAQMPYERCA